MSLYITPISENAVVCVLPPPASLPQQQKLWSFAKALAQCESATSVVVGMNNLTVFSPLDTDLNNLSEQLMHIWQGVQADDYQGQLIEIPVIYGGEYGEDLYEVAQFHHTTPERIVQQHCQTVYTVYMIGFQAGFPYLGGLPESLHTPRRATPRTAVPAGSVGIGGSQTGIYPFASPGGWQIIGRSETVLFDKTQSPPSLLQAGDRVQFVAEQVIL